MKHDEEGDDQLVKDGTDVAPVVEEDLEDVDSPKDTSVSAPSASGKYDGGPIPRK